MIRIFMDNQPIEVAPGTTILKAAQDHGIHIPTLCWHEQLTPYGGCRLCIVEVEGMRNLPTACTTPVSEGMIVRTQTAQVQQIRREILQLFMSEHPSSCLICEERQGCSESTSTIRKVGVTTGCRSCPKDEQCELQAAARELDVEQIDYPIGYRGLQVEKGDPFYDRDYNLCILCGRCVRICQEVRMADTLAFKDSGRAAIVGPAFGRTHLEAGCEFCGACVSVCPTGTLTEKTRKWEGKPEREVSTTCSFCGVGCRIRLWEKAGEVFRGLPDDEGPANRGQLCVKGRFAVPELAHDHRRLTRPSYPAYGVRAELSWEQAVAKAAAMLEDCPPERFAMLLSPNLPLEDLYVAQKFAREVMCSNNVDTSARRFYGAALEPYLGLLERATTLEALSVHAGAILSVGLDVRYGASVVSVALRQALSAGARLVTVHPRDHHLTLNAERWLRPAPGHEANLVKAILAHLGHAGAVPDAGPRGHGVPDDDLAAVAELLRASEAPPVIVLGADLLQQDGAARLLMTLRQLAEVLDARVVAPPVFNNLLGSLLAGAWPELLPGGFSKDEDTRAVAAAKACGCDPATWAGGWRADASGPPPKLLWLIGEALSAEEPAEAVIYQNVFGPPEGAEADLILPAASFTETCGTFVNGEGRLQRVRRAVAPPGEALADWRVLCRIAREMGASGFDYEDVADIHAELSKWIEGLTDLDDIDPSPRPLSFPALGTAAAADDAAPTASEAAPFLLSMSTTPHTYRGVLLSDYVDGARALFTEDVLDLAPEDAEALGLSDGDEVIVSGPLGERSWPARRRAEQAPGTAHLRLPPGDGIGPNPQAVAIRRK